MNSIPPRLYADLIGKPYALSARGPEAYDCLGLAMEMGKRLGLIVPRFLSCEGELHRQLAAGGEMLASLRAAESPEAGCVALMENTPSEHHLGIMLDRWWMLHSMEASGCLRERIGAPFFKHRIIGFYRIPRLECSI
jgi:hypothetical protein